MTTQPTSRPGWSWTTLVLIVALGPWALGGCATTGGAEGDDDSLPPAERQRLQAELRQLDRDIAAKAKELKRIERGKAKTRSAITRAERSAGITGRAGAMSTGGMSSSPPGGWYFKLKLSKATWTMTPRFGAPRRSGSRTYFPFTATYGKRRGR